MLSGPHRSDALDGTVAHANAGGGHDNITALVVRVDVAEAGTAPDNRAEELTRKIEVLKQMPLFHHLSYKEIIRVLNVTEVREFQPGQEIIKEGAAGDEMFIVLRGKIRLHKNGAFITNLASGAHMGEMALVDRGPRSVSATAEERSRVLTLRRREFYQIIRKDPQLSVKLLWSFVQVLADRGPGRAAGCCRGGRGCGPGSTAAARARW